MLRMLVYELALADDSTCRHTDKSNVDTAQSGVTTMSNGDCWREEERSNCYHLQPYENRDEKASYDMG
jgi:hypothetical protein